MFTDFTFLHIQVNNRDPELSAPRNRRARSREIKRATVVGNPMFSSSSSNSSGSPTRGEQLQLLLDTEQPNEQTTINSNNGIDDLNLGMDYNQIMQYFDNLKESNA